MMLEVHVQRVLVASSVTAIIGVGGWRRLAPGLKNVYASFFLVGRPSFEYRARQANSKLGTGKTAFLTPCWAHLLRAYSTHGVICLGKVPLRRQELWF